MSSAPTQIRDRKAQSTVARLAVLPPGAGRSAPGQAGDPRAALEEAVREQSGDDTFEIFMDRRNTNVMGVSADALAVELAERQWFDWRELRFEPLDQPKARKAIAALAKAIVDRLEERQKSGPAAGTVSTKAAHARGEPAGRSRRPLRHREVGP